MLILHYTFYIYTFYAYIYICTHINNPYTYIDSGLVYIYISAREQMKCDEPTSANETTQ